MTFTVAFDPACLPLDQRITAVRDIERDIARLHAVQLRLIAAIDADDCAGAVAPELDKHFVKEQLRAALGESGVSVDHRIDLARELIDRLPLALAPLAAGEITVRHAGLLSDATAPLDDPAAAAVEAAAVPFAAGRDVSAFARKVRREALKADPRGAERRAAAAVEARRVWSRPAEQGSSFVGAILPAEGAQALLAGLDVLGDRTGPADARSADQRRADALVQFGIDALNGYPTCPGCAAHLDDGKRGSGPRWQGLRPAIQVSVALSTLLGLDEQPGELAGHGPIPATLARRLAADPTGTWRRIGTDPLGRLVDYGRTRYRPPADLREHVLARDHTCRFPTCHRAARRADIDHLHRWADGGPTAEPNLLVLCERHHKAKDEGHWQAHLNPDRSVTWTSPTGRIYTVPAATHPIDTTMYVQDDNREDADSIEDAAAAIVAPDDNPAA